MRRRPWWEPGEFTDDTQMALLVASSLVDRGGLDEADLFDRFRTWAAADPQDVGIQTRAVLGSGRPWDVAAAEHFRRTGRAAGNGSLMRTTPAAIRFSRVGAEATMDAARRISALTHGDPSAGEGCAIFHELMRVALDGGDPLAAIPSALDAGRRRAPGSVGDRAGAGLDAGGRHRVERRGVADARPGGVGAAERLATSPR